MLTGKRNFACLNSPEEDKMAKILRVELSEWHSISGKSLVTLKFCSEKWFFPNCRHHDFISFRFARFLSPSECVWQIYSFYFCSMSPLATLNVSFFTSSYDKIIKIIFHWIFDFWEIKSKTQLISFHNTFRWYDRWLNNGEISIKDPSETQW